MAQTKRKRRTKHRGNAAGSIEARGRTGRKPTESEHRKTQSVATDRRFVEPTWAGAAMRAGLASVLLLVLFISGFIGEKQSIPTSILIALVAFLIYVPLGYKVDRFFWERRMRKAGKPLPQPKSK